jgi:hypothetical protein
MASARAAARLPTPGSAVGRRVQADAQLTCRRAQRPARTVPRVRTAIRGRHRALPEGRRQACRFRVDNLPSDCHKAGSSSSAVAREQAGPCSGPVSRRVQPVTRSVRRLARQLSRSVPGELAAAPPIHPPHRDRRPLEIDPRHVTLVCLFYLLEDVLRERERSIRLRASMARSDATALLGSGRIFCGSPMRRPSVLAELDVRSGCSPVAS